MRAVVSERGQVTIPQALRESLGIRPGAVLDFTLEQGRLVAVKQVADDPVGTVRGCLGRGRNTDEFTAMLRGDE
ncbi:MAG: AbrB/MazE/SpoVT family DNA-binding domain-containing protein [Sulfurisoma sp.]|nr:AbrB/MazE/SpoVT family DNA-binding domain-containing protein [Sulfurisoma sp.]